MKISRLALIVTPPVELEVGGAFWLSSILSLAWVAFAVDFFAPAFDPNVDRTVAIGILVAGIVAIFGFIYWQRGRWRETAVLDYEARLQAWSRQWRCLRCDYVGDKGSFEGSRCGTADAGWRSAPTSEEPLT